MKQILSLAWIYQLYQWLVGANKYTRLFAHKYIRYQKGQKILDIGCGPADILAQLPLDVDYTGIDLSSKYISRAQQSHPHQTFICGDIGNPDFPLDNERYDTVFLIGVQHHLTDAIVDKMFAFAYQKLKPGGRMLCLEPVYCAGQGAIEKMFMRNDRGKYIRTEAGYLALMQKQFNHVESEIRPNTMNIPFTVVILQAQKS